MISIAFCPKIARCVKKKVTKISPNSHLDVSDESFKAGIYHIIGLRHRRRRRIVPVSVEQRITSGSRRDRRLHHSVRVHEKLERRVVGEHRRLRPEKPDASGFEKKTRRVNELTKEIS